MYCNACGRSIADDAHFCSYCGLTVGNHIPRKLVRSRADRRIAGVCAGLASYLGLDATLARLLWVFVTFVSGILPGVLVYVLAWIIVPEEPVARAVVPVTTNPAGYPAPTT